MYVNIHIHGLVALKLSQNTGLLSGWIIERKSDDEMMEQDARSLKKTPITTSILATNLGHFKNVCQNGDINVDSDSCGFTDTPYDTVSIKINGENHWVSGVDSNTTCTDLIRALFYYHELEKTRSSDSKKSGRSTIITSLITNHYSLTTNTKEIEQTSYGRRLPKLHPYVIVKQLPDCRFEEYLDGSTRLLDVILENKPCKLELRNLVKTTSPDASPRILANQKHMLSMLSMSTDNDSGMDSPVGSSRSVRYRRRRGKQRSGLSTIPATKLFRGTSILPNQNMEEQLRYCNANSNERLMNLILAQDETINRQIYLLNEKEQQIFLIEDEKHQERQRKLGKNYMLDSYMSATDKLINKKLNIQDLNDQWEKVEHSNQDLPITTNMGELCSSNQPISVEIYWLEKIYALNKELQREEEQLLRLHAKIRKHQMRFAYYTKDDVLQQIYRLDTELTNQVEDIYKAERQLLTANEQLKAKLGVLECLGHELEILPLKNQEVKKSSTECLTLRKTALSSQSYEDIAEPFVRNVQKVKIDTLKADHQLYVKSFFSQNLIEKYSKVRDKKNDKTIRKKIFTDVNNPENVCALVTEDSCTMTKLDWCYSNLESRNQRNCTPDIEHFGTLV